MIVYNLPINFSKFSYIVARRVNGALWFWGAFRKRNDANEAALEVGGVTLEVTEVERG